MSTNLWNSASAGICSSAAPVINTTVTIPSVSHFTATNAAPSFVGGFQTVDNASPWQTSQDFQNGQWVGSYGNPTIVGGTVQGGTTIGVGIPYEYSEPYVPPFVPNNGDVLTTDGNGSLQWTPYIAPSTPAALELIQQLIAQGLMELGEDGILRMVPAFPAPRSEAKSATKIPFTYIDEEELYLEIERFE